LQRGGRELWIATFLVAIVVFGYPLLAPLAGRAWTTTESSGWPDWRSRLAVLALVRGRALAAAGGSLLWCAVTALTLSA
jgi:hypothetical protein